MADPLERLLDVARARSGSTGHVADPEMIAPGLREPPTAVTEREAAALVAYVRQAVAPAVPGLPAADRDAPPACGRATASAATTSTATAARTARS